MGQLDGGYQPGGWAFSIKAGARLHSDLRRKPAVCPSEEGENRLLRDTSRAGRVSNSISVRLTLKTKQPKNWDQQKIKAVHKFLKNPETSQLNKLKKSFRGARKSKF